MAKKRRSHSRVRAAGKPIAGTAPKSVTVYLGGVEAKGAAAGFRSTVPPPDISLSAESLNVGSPDLGRPPLTQHVALNASADQTIPNFQQKATAATGSKPRKPKTVVIRDKRTLIIQTTTLLAALEGALLYDPKRHGNSPEPELRRDLDLGKATSAKDIRELVEELKRLNAYLEKTGVKPKKGAVAIAAEKGLVKFAERYAAQVGTGAGIMTIGAALTALHQMGFDTVVLMTLLWKGSGGIGRLPK